MFNYYFYFLKAQSQPPVSHHQPEVTPWSHHYPWSLECSPSALLLSGRLITPTLQGLPSQAASQSGFLEEHTIPDWDQTDNPGPVTSLPPNPPNSSPGAGRDPTLFCLMASHYSSNVLRFPRTCVYIGPLSPPVCANAEKYWFVLSSPLL